MNNLDQQYTELLQDILDNGARKGDRTGTGTISVFGRTIRHKMSEGFPLLTTKKMHFKGIVTELVWFLRGDTNIKFLVDNGCNIWVGDAYKKYKKLNQDSQYDDNGVGSFRIYTEIEFINKIKTDAQFAKEWGELGPIYGKQWRDWNGKKTDGFIDYESNNYSDHKKGIDQIANLLSDLKNNPDSRRLMINAWNVGEIDSMVLPPCHYGFQLYTRELSLEERHQIHTNNISKMTGRDMFVIYDGIEEDRSKFYDEYNIPSRAISLSWNQRSVDTFLGLPYNIASYGLLLEIIAEVVNMVPDELVGNLGDTHLYLNHIEQAKEQIGKDLSLEEREVIYKENGYVPDLHPFNGDWVGEYDGFKIPRRTREPFPLSKLNINTEFWSTENGSCGEGPLSATGFISGLANEHFCKCLLESDIQLSNYVSHPAIKAPLSN